MSLDDPTKKKNPLQYMNHDDKEAEIKIIINCTKIQINNAILIALRRVKE